MTTLAVITGASRGIGAAIASAAADDGAVVATCNRGPSEAEHQLTADLSEPAAWTAFATWYDGLVDQLTPDRAIVVHNAATLTPIGFAGETDPDAYRANVLLNSAAPQILGSSVIATARRVTLPTVLMQLSSGAAATPYTGWTSYCAAKAGVEMWARTAGLEQAERDDLVKVMAIAPGVVATEMQAEIRTSASETFPDVERFRTMHAEGGLADPTVVGGRLWHLAEAADWENGWVTDLRQLG